MATPVEALQICAKFKYLTAEYYRRGLEAFATGTQAFTPGQAAVVGRIAVHEAAHVTQLRNILGSSAPAQPAQNTTYTFSAPVPGSPTAGPFAGALGSTGTAPYTGATKADFFRLTQLFEDFAVRLIKGRLVDVMPDKSALNLLAAMHATDGRHAAESRIMRSGTGKTPVNSSSLAYTALVFPWITSTSGISMDTGAAPAFTGTSADTNSQVYVGNLVYGVGPTGAAANTTPSTAEANTVQAGFSVASMDAFDEPIDMTSAAAFLARFNVTA